MTHFTSLEKASKNTPIWQASKIAGLLFLFIIFFSCSSNDKVVATVGETELLESEAKILMEHAGLDSKNKEVYKQFVNSWCDRQLYIEELKLNHPDKWKLIQLRANSYSGDLAKFYIEEIEIKSKLDTLVSDKEIKAYYDKHKKDFILQDYLVKGLYLKIPVSADYKTKKINTHYLLKNDKDLAQVDSYAKLYAQNYYFNVTDWKFFNEVFKEVPLRKYNKDNIVLNRSKTYFSDDEYTYFINITDYKLKDEVSPLEFLKDDIREIIIAKRLHKMKGASSTGIKKKIKETHEVSIHI